ncbi:5'-AMP-activated protein kinase subunit gamma-1-like isoform X7 [Varroa jacobsoni]|uniref:5'-AMP-activated protein kinase subunit gamma-1-like isoform X7 n=1 Tax=Varroa jacobsoni TaxID=62625 RepID=UPI000BF7F9A1|nr:5'-AMP-activated protein kinase subunit gamma-1-like isoform X7 [Varroa jacobsoni]
MVMSPSPSVYPPLPHDRTVKRLASDERTRSRSLHGIERKALIGRRDSSVDSTESCTAECPNSGFTYSLGRSLKCGSYGPDQSLASTLPIPSVGPTCDYANCNNNSGSPCGNNNSSNIVGGDLNLRTPVLRTVRRAVNLLRKTLTDSLTSLGSYTSSTESLQEQAITSGNNLFRPAHRAGNKTMIVQSPAMYVSTTGMHTPPPLSCVSVSSSHTSRCSTTVKLTSSDTSICEDRIDIEDLGADESLLFVKFFRYYHCYDLIPLSAKLVVFDTQLQVKKAFFALESNGVRAAPLWDSAQQQFVGMLTISDFIQMLRKYYRNPQLQMDELEQHKIDTWRTVLTNMQRLLVSIGPDASLCDAIIALIHQRVHRLPVIDPQTGNVLYVLTHKRILRFLFLYFYDLPHSTYLDKSIRELNVGTFENIATCTPDTPLIVALDTFVERRVSALPVVANDGRVVDIYAKFDVINLAAEKTYSKLDMSVGQALEFRNEFFEGVLTCSADDSLLEVMKKIVVAEVHRLVIADDNGCCVGIVSLSDILLFLVLNPLGMERPASRAYLMRTTSSERENGPVAEEPELEATANAFGEQAVVNSWRRSSTLDDTELRSSVDLPLEMPGSLF